MSLKYRVRLVLLAVLLLASGVGVQAAVTPAPSGLRDCRTCSCPFFSGTGYTCNRYGCNHHSDSHR